MMSNAICKNLRYFKMSENTIKRYCNKPSTKKWLLALLTISVLTLTVFLLAWSIKLSVISTPCTTPGCLQATAILLSHLDTTVDPCENFFEFACGNYLKASRWQNRKAPIEELNYEISSQIEDILREPVRDTDHGSIKLQKTLINICMNETAMDSSLVVFQQILDELRGWPLVEGFNWNEDLFNWKTAVHTLRNRGYYHSMMLTVGPVINPRNSSEYVIRVEEPYIHLHENSKYKHYLRNVALFFGADKQNVDSEIDKVIDFKSSLKNISKLNRWNINNLNNNNENQTNILLSRMFTLEEFKEHSNEINWSEFINIILNPVANISNNDYVVFPKANFLVEFFNLLNTTPRRVQANYIIWEALEPLLPFMPKKLRQISSNYDFQLNGYLCTNTRFKFCKNEVNKSFFLRPADVLFATKYVSNEKLEKMGVLFRSVKLQFIKMLMNSDWMDIETKRRAIKKADEIVEFIGRIGNYKDFMLDNYTAQDNEMFLDLYLKTLKQKSNLQYSILNKSPTEVKIIEAYNLVAKADALYMPEENMIFLPSGLLQGMFYDEDRPMFMNYGIMGYIVGHELTHAFDRIGNERSQINNGYKVWSDRTNRQYEEKTKCFDRMTDEVNKVNSTRKINSTRTLEENIADFTGIKAAYMGYKKWVEENREEPHLPGLNFNPYQLFWISTAMMHCYHVNDEDVKKAFQHDTHALNLFRVIEPLRNNEHFVTDFNCPVGSKMNLQNKCQLF